MKQKTKRDLISYFTFSRYCKEGNFVRPQRGSSLPQSTHAIGSTRTSHGSGYKRSYICQLERDIESQNMEMSPMGFEVQEKWGQGTHKLFKNITSRMNHIMNALLISKL
jgi:hypothetical protein